MNPDDEARVFYVGVTRAKENLYIMSPQTSLYYPL
jgi:superfamily I DNA/RNA helicase